MPDPRPLYRLPDVARADTVVLVEGEKCADALMQIGIVATTAMGGAATAIDKTDWSPLTGKTVIDWPNHDEAGARYTNVVIPKLVSIGAKVQRISVPDDKPQKWDAADSVAEGVDVHALLTNAVPVTNDQPRQPFEIAQWRARKRFTGDPQPRRWRCRQVLPSAGAGPRGRSLRWRMGQCANPVRRRARQIDVDLVPDLKAAIARAAAEGKPYTKTGGNGVYERRHELPEAFHAIGKHRLAEWVGTLLDREELVMAMVDGTKLVKWLDVPDGPVASGEAAFVTGHLKRANAGQRDQA